VRDLAVLFLHLLATVARLAGPGGAREVVAESVLVKHQLLILNRARKRSPNLRPSDRVVAGLSALFMRPGRLMRSAITMTGMHPRDERAAAWRDCAGRPLSGDYSSEARARSPPGGGISEWSSIASPTLWASATVPQ
jgi:hypothetical protein